MKSVVICAGGPESEIADLTAYCRADTVFIGADRGTLYLLANGIVPREAVGDFDSVSKNEYATIVEAVKVVGRYRSEKNETDTELAVERALTYAPKQIILTGVTGGRLDHFESSLQLLYRMQIKYPNILFKIRNRLNELSVLLPGFCKLEFDEHFQYVSFFPFGGPVTGLALTGFKYETKDATLEMGMTKFTSNEQASRNCTISFLEGICLMVRSTDA